MDESGMAAVFSAMITDVEFETSVSIMADNCVDICLNCANISCKSDIVHKTNLDC